MARLRWYASGDFSKSKAWLKKLHSKRFQNILMKYAQEGVDALKAATPKDTGYTAESWYADVVIGDTTAVINWKNSHYEVSGKTGVEYPIAILIDIGHGTGTGGYVQPRPYIDDAITPVVENIAEMIRKEVLS